MITEAEIEQRLTQVRNERDQVVMQLGAYNGVIAELESMLSRSRSSNNNKKDTNKEK